RLHHRSKRDWNSDVCSSDLAASSEATSSEAASSEAASEPAEEASPEGAAAVMSYEEYMAAAVDDPVTIQAYVQAKQSYYAEQGKIGRASCRERRETVEHRRC